VGTAGFWFAASPGRRTQPKPAAGMRPTILKNQPGGDCCWPMAAPTNPIKGGETMDQKQILKQMIDFNKATFDNTFNAMVMLQEQAERAANTLLEQANWLPEDGNKAINEWVKAYKKGREDFKKVVDENFQKVESFFSGTK
jgi:hypothetical protein